MGKTKHLYLILLSVLVVSIGSSWASSITPDTTQTEYTSAGEQLDAENIENLNATSFEEGLKITWNLNYQLIPELHKENYKLIVAYNKELEAERLEKGYDVTEWEFIENIDLNQTSIKVKGLSGGEDYVYKIGLSNGSETVWSESK